MEEFITAVGIFVALMLIVAVPIVSIYWICDTPWTRAVRAQRHFEDAMSQLSKLEREYDVGYENFLIRGLEISEKVRYDGDDLNNSSAAADYNNLVRQIEGIIKNKHSYKRLPRRRYLGGC